jgi:hypothetical protein
MHSDDFNVVDSDETSRKSRRLAILYILMNFFAIVLTGIPVLAEFGDIYPSHSQWYESCNRRYTGNDIFRLLEPIVALPFQILIMLEAPLFPMNSKSYALLIAFSISAAIYQQGAGFHSASNMFKHSIKTAVEAASNQKIPLSPSELAVQDILQQIYSWMRNDWLFLLM